jgi:hypothetical protein
MCQGYITGKQKQNEDIWKGLHIYSVNGRTHNYIEDSIIRFKRKSNDKLPKIPHVTNQWNVVYRDIAISKLEHASV